MKKSVFFFLVIISCLAGVVFFLMQRNWIIIQFTFNPKVYSSTDFVDKDSGINKAVKIYYWKHDKWFGEEVSIIWQDKKHAQNIKHLLKQWLMVMQDERLIPPHVMLESVALSSAKSDVLISFDQGLFFKDLSIIKKWMIVESLLKTLRFVDASLQTVALLVHHQPMSDDHLDLDSSIPIQERP